MSSEVMDTKELKNEITEGVIWKQLLIFFFPIVVGTLFQQLYNTVDAVIVGRFVGKAALASVGGSAAVLTYQVVMFFTSLANGAAVVISQFYGAKNAQRLHAALHTAAAFAIIASVIISVIGFLATPTLLAVMKTPEDIMADSIGYLRIYFLGITAMLIYNMGSGIMRAVGDSRRPLYYLIICCILNILLDIVLVVFFKLGIVGAAIATIISQAVSAVLVVRALMTSYEMIRLIPKDMRIDLPLLISQLRIGIPGGIQSLMYGLTNVIIQTSINQFGTDTAAAWAAFGKVDAIFWAVSGAFGISITTFSGQNYGAGKLDRVYRSVRTCLGMSLALCGSILIGLLVLAHPLLSLFTSDETVIGLGTYMMFNIVPSYAIFIFVEIFTGALRGIGDVMIPTFITLGGVCLVRLPWILIVTPIRKELFTILVSYPIAWAATALFLIPYYFYRKKKLNERWKKTSS